MSLQEDREILQSEKQTYLDRLEKLEGRKDKVKPELYEKLRGEIDDKVAAVSARLTEVEKALEEEERRLEEERRRQEEEAKRTSQKDLRNRILEKYADELQALKDQWQQRQDTRRGELNSHADVLREQHKEMEGELAKVKEEVEELILRKEIGEFEDNEEEYQSSNAELKKRAESLEADLNARDVELGKVSEQIQEMDQEEPPDFTEQVIENHADELIEPEPEEEIYEPEEEIYEPAGKVIEEEEISQEEIGEGEEIVTEVEEVYEDEAEQAFFEGKKEGLISATINPCLIERLSGGEEKIHNLMLGGAKTLIGSSELCDVYLPYTSVEGKHAWIKVDRKAQYLIKDLSSKNNTFVNGKKVKKSYLQNGDQIKIGDLRLTVKLI